MIGRIGVFGETKVHDFNERLQFSQDHRNELFWEQIYRKAFPDMEWCKACLEDGQGQRMGIDRIIYLKSGKQLSIDEKLREAVYQDIFLEFLSNDQTGALGWIEKPLNIDYLAYAFLPNKHCYLFDWLMLRRAWQQYKTEWMAHYGSKPAKNKGYITLGCPVPITILLKAVSNARIIQIDE